MVGTRGRLRPVYSGLCVPAHLLPQRLHDNDRAAAEEVWRSSHPGVDIVPFPDGQPVHLSAHRSVRRLAVSAVDVRPGHPAYGDRNNVRCRRSRVRHSRRIAGRGGFRHLQWRTDPVAGPARRVPVTVGDQL